jgi:hypothetical protein
MTYSSQITRNKPTAILFVIDQSASMLDPMASSGVQKAQFVADVLNKTLYNLVVACTKQDGVRNYFEVGVIGYGGTSIGNAFSGPLSHTTLNSLSAIYGAPLRVEDRYKKVPDGAGGLVEVSTKFPVWYEAHGNGNTPMCQALRRAAEVIAPWCDANMDSFPPTVIHVTDGESTDSEDPLELARNFRELGTSDGKVLLMNLHVSSAPSAAMTFPSSEVGLVNDFARRLFNMSSTLPAPMVSYAHSLGLTNLTSESRAFCFNAEAQEIIEFFDIGSKPQGALIAQGDR